jgi:hypothetical protein
MFINLVATALHKVCNCVNYVNLAGVKVFEHLGFGVQVTQSSNTEKMLKEVRCQTHQTKNLSWLKTPIEPTPLDSLPDRLRTIGCIIDADRESL